MSRLQHVSPEAATGQAKELLNAVKGKLGMIPNMTQVMAIAPSVLDGYLSLSGALSKGSLPPKTREHISLAVGEANSCNYCVSAHSAIGKSVGLTAEQILDSRRGTAVDPKADAAIQFARQVLETRGQVSNADLSAARAAGLDDPALAEIVANVALNVFSNYFNNVAETEIDFPKAAPLNRESASACGTEACHVR